MSKQEFQDLNFQIEVSTRYHEWRRATFLRWSAMVKFLSIVGAFLSFAFLWATPTGFVVWDFTITPSVFASFASALIAFVNIIALVFDYDGKAMVHTDLYKQFKGLQEKIARKQDSWTEFHRDWEADAEAIRINEPPMKWAVYAMCWNQTAYRVGNVMLREVGPFQRLTRNLIPFTFESFPAGRVT